MTSTPPTSTGSSSASQGSASAAAAILDQTQERVGHVADQAQQAAQQVTAQAKQQATSQFESQKERAVDGLVAVAAALRQTGEHLHDQEQGTVGEYVSQAADRVESLANHLLLNDVPELLAESQDFARRRPGLFLSAAVALGFVGARFLMSSGQRARAQRNPSTKSGLSSPHAAQSEYGGPSSFAQPDSAYDSFDSAKRTVTGADVDSASTPVA